MTAARAAAGVYLTLSEASRILDALRRAPVLDVADLELLQTLALLIAASRAKGEGPFVPAPSPTKEPASDA